MFRPRQNHRVSRGSVGSGSNHDESSSCMTGLTGLGVSIVDDDWVLARSGTALPVPWCHGALRRGQKGDEKLGTGFLQLVGWTNVVKGCEREIWGVIRIFLRRPGDFLAFGHFFASLPSLHVVEWGCVALARPVCGTCPPSFVPSKLSQNHSKPAILEQEMVQSVETLQDVLNKIN